MDDGCMPLRDKSVTLMRFYGFPHHGNRFFAGALNDALPVFLTTGTDPSHPLRMTFNISLTMTLNASLIMTPFLQLSFWTGASMPCGKDGKRNDESEWRIYYPDNVLPASSPRVQILRIRSGWRFMVFFITAASLRHRSGWYLTVRRQKKLLAHAVRLRILACRNDLNRKRTISL